MKKQLFTGKWICNSNTNKHVWNEPRRLDFLFQWLIDLLFYRGLEELMNFKIANLTQSATGSGIVVRRNGSFKIYFLYDFPFLILDSLLAIYSYKIFESGSMMVWKRHAIKSIREKGRGDFALSPKLIL